MNSTRVGKTQERSKPQDEILTSTPPVTRLRKTPPGSVAITLAQVRVLSAVRSLTRKFDVPPARSELARYLGYQGGQGSVDGLLMRLAAKGWLRIMPGIERGIVLLREGAPLYEPEQLEHTETEICLRGEGPAEPAWIDYEVLWACSGRNRICVCACAATRWNAPDSQTEQSSRCRAIATHRDNINIADGDIVAAYIDDKVVLRSVRKVAKGTVELYAESTSDEHKSVLFEPGSNSVEIVGVVIGRMVAGAR